MKTMVNTMIHHTIYSENNVDMDLSEKRKTGKSEEYRSLSIDGISLFMNEKQLEQLEKLIDSTIHDETETAEALYKEVSRLRNRVRELESSEEMLKVYQRNAPFYLERAR